MAVSFLETGVLYCDDNLRQLAQFPDECVDLIYLDPPFFTNRYYEVIWGDEAEVRSFEDRWEGGINVYTNWMRDRVMQMRRVLKSTGSLYLHCDWHAGHYLKVMCDQIFGRNNFRNEIVWSYRTGGASRKYFARKHDTILFYTKTERYIFNLQKEKSYMMHKYGFKKSDFYEDESGQYTWVFMRDVWDIPSVGSADKQRLHYPTQKPEALLERIIESSSNKGDVVLDPFCGCGTTVAVAERMSRRWIGIDISPTAVNLMKRRLEKVANRRCIPKTVGLPITVDELRKLKPFEFQNWVIQKFWGTPSPRRSGDMGIDGYSFMRLIGNSA